MEHFSYVYWCCKRSGTDIYHTAVYAHVTQPLNNILTFFALFYYLLFIIAKFQKKCIETLKRTEELHI